MSCDFPDKKAQTPDYCWRRVKLIKNIQKIWEKIENMFENFNFQKVLKQFQHQFLPYRKQKLKKTK